MGEGRLGVLGVAVLLLAVPAAAHAELPQQNGAVELLDQANVSIFGTEKDSFAGEVGFAGDVNGDGVGDIVVSRPLADTNGADSGAAWVIYGGPGLAQVTLDESGLPPSQGFLIRGSGPDVAAGVGVGGTGDVNNDGFDDVVLGETEADPSGDNSGAAYVVYGAASRGTVTLDTAGLPPTTGFAMLGAQAQDILRSGPNDDDLNGDGIDDVVLGAPNEPPGSGSTNPGHAYVVYGLSGPRGTVQLDNTALPPATGFVITGATATSLTGSDVAGTRDVNGDGLGDLIVGAPADLNNESRSYVVFGKPGTRGTFVLDAAGLPATDGFLVKGAAGLGVATAGAGDVNGDGFDDVLLGTSFTQQHGEATGSAFVIYGSATPETVTVNDTGIPPQTGFLIAGTAEMESLGDDVSGGGDLNADGRDDVLVGANGAGGGNGVAFAIFGKPGQGTVSPDPNGLSPSVGFVMRGAPGSLAGDKVGGGGDINGDNRPDALTTAPFADPNGPQTGAAYAIYGFGPPSVTYPHPIFARAGTPITPVVPTVERTGQPTFTVSPPLPTGLELDTQTGVISGTPLGAHPPRRYIVTMTDLAGVAQGPIDIGVFGEEREPEHRDTRLVPDLAALLAAAFDRANGARIALSRSGRVRIVVPAEACPATDSADCDGSLGLSADVPGRRRRTRAARVVTLGRRAFAQQPGRAAAVRIRASARNRRTLQRARRVPATARLTVREQGGRATTATLRFTLVARRAVRR
jgi:hypothetical protein